MGFELNANNERIFKIDVGSMSASKVLKLLKDIKNKLK